MKLAKIENINTIASIEKKLMSEQNQ